MKTVQEECQYDGIAIIGLAGRFPGAPGIDQFWQNLCTGVESIRSFQDAELLAAGEDPSLVHSSAYVKANAVLEGVDLFDADFFGFTPREAEVTDPQHRIFLECAWEALENAGYDPDQYNGRIGVFAGAGLHCYYQHNLASNPHLVKVLGDLSRFIAIEKDFLSTRVSYRLNLKGPSISIQTACSTSLVSVHLGCQSLLNGESDMVLAGGVSIKLPQIAGYLYQEGSILSPDGHCRAFDAAAGGTVFGSGAGIVVLKRWADALSDGDHIHAVIRGSGINNDGALKVGYTAPSVDGQARLIAEVQAVAGVTADEVSYVETHGTGTTLGDPIEVTALTKAFRGTTQNNGFCAIGSLKTNIGHLDAAAGVAGLIKVVLSLESGKLPPSLNFSQPNPAIDFDSSPFYVQRTLSDWKPATGRRIAGVSSFGIGGTNAHVVVEEAPPFTSSDYSRTWQMIPISARTPKALEKATDRLGHSLKTHHQLNFADLAFTLQQGRKAFAHRRILVAESTHDAIALLESRVPKRVHTGRAFEGDASVVFMFPAQGAQHANMGRDLYEHESVFREQVDRCAMYLQPILGIDLRSILYPTEENVPDSNEKLRQTRITQPAVFTVSYALAQLWMSWGIKPAAMIGHSLGEYVAATLAGVFDLEDALNLVSERARLMQLLPSGSMLAVHLSEDDLRPWLSEDVSLAAVNAPTLSVLSGPTAAIDHLADTLRKEQIEVQPLLTSHAFHSAMMQPMIEQFEERVAQTDRHAPQVPFVSTLTGTWIRAEQATNPAYWGQQTRYGVRFSPAVLELMKVRGNILLEVGPGNSLSTLAKLHLTPESQYKVVNSLPHAKEHRSHLDCMLTALGDLWVAGVSIDWRLLHGTDQRRRVPLPSYPFERQRFWVELKGQPLPVTNTAEHAIQVRKGSEDKEASIASSGMPGDADMSIGTSPRPDLKTSYVTPRSDIEKTLAKLWQDVLGLTEVGIDDNFFELGGQSLMAVTLVAEIGRVLGGRFSLAALIGAPTIRQFAEVVSKQQPLKRRVLSSGDPATVEGQVRGFIVENYLSGRANGLKNDESLLKHRVIDQMGFLQIAAFLEETYGLVVKDEELTRANMDSISNICAYVCRRLDGTADAVLPPFTICAQDPTTIQ